MKKDDIGFALLVIGILIMAFSVPPWVLGVIGGAMISFVGIAWIGGKK